MAETSAAATTASPTATTTAAAGCFLLPEGGAGEHGERVIASILAQTTPLWRCYYGAGWADLLPAGDGRFRPLENEIWDEQLPCVLLRSAVELEPTALETTLWILDSHPAHGIVRGRLNRGPGQDPYPNNFQAKEFVKRPHLLGGAVALRSVGDPGDPIGSVCQLLAAGQLGFFAAHRFGIELSPPPELPALDPKQAHLFSEAVPPAVTRPTHDRFVHAPTGPGPGLFPASAGPATEPAGHVVFLVPHFAMGGSDKFTLDLARALQARFGLSVSFLATLSQDDGWWTEFSGLTPLLYPLQRFLTRPDFPRFIRDHIRAQRPRAVVVTHSQLGYQLLPFLRQECPETPFIDYLHIEEEDWREGGYPGLSLQYRNHLDATLVSSRHLRRWLLQRGGNENRISVHTTNIDPAVWDPGLHDTRAIRAALNVPEDTPLLLFAGRLVEQKRPRLLAGILRRLSLDEGTETFHALIAGDGPEEPWLGDFVQKHDLGSKVTLLGRATPSRIRELMAAADIFLLPSRNEGISLALYEAMAMRCAPVAADVGGQRELVHDETVGFLIPTSPREGDEESAYAEAVARLVRSTETSAAMGAAARQRICDNFTVEQMADGIWSKISSLGREQAQDQPADPHTVAALVDEVIEGFRLEQELYLATKADNPPPASHPTADRRQGRELEPKGSFLSAARRMFGKP